jgi:hypothetical protein
MTIQQSNKHTVQTDIAKEIAEHLMAYSGIWQKHPDTTTRLLTTREDQQQISLDLTPFSGGQTHDDARDFFDSISTFDELIAAYERAKSAKPFEPTDQVLPYAETFLGLCFERARQVYSDEDATLIAQWVKNLDVYAAVKSVECLLDTKDNLALFRLAKERGWTILFDHLAIRCSSTPGYDAKAISEMLIEHHGYQHPQIEDERHYVFDDGWSAFPLYKTLNNGLTLRLFVDQSDYGFPEQIIQHWNRVYGYTAHHLALRAIHIDQGRKLAVPLADIINNPEDTGIKALQPTGYYTQGLLEQVFLKPHLNKDVPEEITSMLNDMHDNLGKTIRNGKLLELVSRRELQKDIAEKVFALNGLKYDPKNPLHSAPMYDYFLPAQAAHVIQTSIQTEFLEQAL